ncbi:exonuclease V, chloroplastic isoform X1 [Canna indica]|uniref:Exonuclease V, chloroplastic isoform X1 n=1 Tax=Canna indica TaxID=4628 RepID=A0AAQ3KTT7_9LILI|nr:exonuclease V, chloroplastic isoform X1 [Canna indica]
MNASSSPSSSSSSAISITNTTTSGSKDGVHIPVEIVSEDEMAFLEAALASTRPLLSSSPCSLSSPASSSSSRFALLSARPSLLCGSPVRKSSTRPQSLSTTLDIEDPVPPRPSLFARFRSRRGLSVTDITATEWCEKQMEFVLLHGKPKRTEAMEAGCERHSQLEKEVLEKVELHTESVEDYWAIKLMNFIAGAHQLLFEGLTREIPVVGVIEGIWMVGVIDEIRMPGDGYGDTACPLLVDIKTRYKATGPSEAQKRNARLQLMSYKYLWDNLVTVNFPIDQFFHHFKLNRQYTLSRDVKKFIDSFGFDIKTLEDVLTYFQDTCCLLSPCHDQLLLRYELQSDQSLLEECYISYDSSWFQQRIRKCLEFWLGDREADFVSEGEQWKCRFCAFASVCPLSATTSSKRART